MARVKPSPFLLFALASTAFFIPTVASADSATEARVLYQKGNKAFRDGDDVMAREYYRKSLELEDSFDTLCNLGRAEARSKLHEEAYEHLRLCVELYPSDPDLAESKGQYRDLREEVSKELSFEVKKPIDERVDAELKRREEEETAASAPPKEEGDTLPSPDPGLSEEPREKNKWKLPVSVSLVGAGVASGVVSAVFFARAATLQGDADDLRGDLATDACSGPDPASACQDITGTLEKSDSAQHVALGTAIAGGALLVGGMLVFLLVPSEKRAQTALSKPSLLPQFSVLPHQGWHLGVSGKF